MLRIDLLNCSVCLLLSATYVGLEMLAALQGLNPRFLREASLS